MRLNNVIALLEQGQTPITVFSPPTIESAIEFATTNTTASSLKRSTTRTTYERCATACRTLLNRKQIVDVGSVSPAVTPIIRIPPNGGELNQWLAKQVLDIGADGVVWPHVSTVEQAYNAVSACRYPRAKGSPAYEPEGIRGDRSPSRPRYWGITPQDITKALNGRPAARP